jgi:hypothetical protein
MNTPKQNEKTYYNAIKKAEEKGTEYRQAQYTSNWHQHGRMYTNVKSQS